MSLLRKWLMKVWTESNKDFDLEFLGAKQRFMRQGQTPNDSQLMALKKDILERLIDRELL